MLDYSQLNSVIYIISKYVFDIMIIWKDLVITQKFLRQVNYTLAFVFIYLIKNDQIEHCEAFIWELLYLLSIYRMLEFRWSFFYLHWCNQIWEKKCPRSRKKIAIFLTNISYCNSNTFLHIFFEDECPNYWTVK